MRRLVLAALLSLSVGVAARVAWAEEPAEVGHEAASAGHESEEHGIVNWWSWDYGPNAKDPEHKNWPPPFGFALVNFGLFAAIMYRLAGKPLQIFVKERHERIARELKEAADLRRAAEDELITYKKKVAGVDAEVNALLEALKQQAELERTRILAAAEEQAKRIKEDADKQIQAEIARARAQLRRDVVERALGTAGETLRQQIGADDQRKMAERYVADVERTAVRGRP